MPRLADLTGQPQAEPTPIPAGTLQDLGNPMQALQKAQTIGAPTYPPVMGRMPMGPGLATSLVATWNDPGKASWMAKRLTNDTLMNWAGEKAKELLAGLRK